MSSFKVMPWLRALRDRDAAEEHGCSAEERLARHRREAAPLVEQFLRSHPGVRPPAVGNAARVAEDRPPYGPVPAQRE